MAHSSLWPVVFITVSITVSLLLLQYFIPSFLHLLFLVLTFVFCSFDLLVVYEFLVDILYVDVELKLDQECKLCND